MSTVAPQAAVGTGSPGGSGRRRTARRRWIIAAAAVVAVGVVAVLVVRPFGRATPRGRGMSDNGYPASLAPVTRRTLTSQLSEQGTLGYARSYSVVNQAQGVYTSLPAAGRVIRQGQVLYRVSGSPVVLLYGRVPAYRDLVVGTIGADVRELNRDLVALRYAARSQLDPSSNVFSAETAAAVERLQEHLGMTLTGGLTLGQVAFLPSAIRITAVSGVSGNAAAPGPLMSATSTARQVDVSLNPADQQYANTGDRVTIVLPGGKPVPGRVASVAKVATTTGSAGSPGGSSPTIEVAVVPRHPDVIGNLDQAPVQVLITTARLRSVLVVPVNALLAEAGGGYAVEEVAPGGAHHLVTVAPGLFDDAGGVVQVTGPGLAAGQRVVVPGP